MSAEYDSNLEPKDKVRQAVFHRLVELNVNPQLLMLMPNNAFHAFSDGSAVLVVLSPTPDRLGMMFIKPGNFTPEHYTK